MEGKGMEGKEREGKGIVIKFIYAQRFTYIQQKKLGNSIRMGSFPPLRTILHFLLFGKIGAVFRC